MALERAYVGELILRLKGLFPGCIVRKQDPYPQGWPDLVIFWGDRWAMLEVKRNRLSPTQPNQEHYVSVLNEMSFAAIIHPDNEDEVLDELQRSFATGR